MPLESVGSGDADGDEDDDDGDNMADEVGECLLRWWLPCELLLSPACRSMSMVQSSSLFLLPFSLQEGLHGPLESLEMVRR